MDLELYMSFQYFLGDSTKYLTQSQSCLFTTTSGLISQYREVMVEVGYAARLKLTHIQGSKE